MNKKILHFCENNPGAEYFYVSNKAIKEIIPQTRNKSGCLNFTFHANKNGILYPYEEWVDDKSISHHHSMDYAKAGFKVYKLWIAIPPEISILSKLT